jgi:two-component system response regulator PilR (NtrC family)
MPENLLESELFGHEKGSFTGAIKEKKGLFQEADQGTLFLDEIGDMTPPMQVKLLRVLQNKTVRKVGGTHEVAVDARIIAATNRNLEKLVRDGSFREDLFYRIHVIPILLPPLRERRDDIPLLTDYFIHHFSSESGLEAKTMTAEAMRVLEGYPWPGNVRELENLVERTLALCAGDTISTKDLPVQVTRPTISLENPAYLPDEGLDLEGHLDQIRIDLMAQALEREEGVQTRAAELLGMSFRSFRYYARKVGVLGGDDDTEAID